MASFQGEIAALLTAACWSTNSVFFSLAGKRVGSATVNHIRLWVAFFSLIILHLVFFGSPFPFSADTERFLWFGLSGFFGFLVGDSFLFEAFVLIGPRLSMLLMVLAPIFSTALAWLFLGETLGAGRICAIALTVAGIGWVVSAGNNHRQVEKRKMVAGVLLGIGGAFGQATGYLFSKLGMEGGFPAVSGNLIRLTAATLSFGLFNLVRGKMREEVVKLRDRRAFGQIVAGALLGPVTGVVLSLYAVSRAHLGVAATLMSLSPVLLLPISRFLFHEKITLRAVFGTLAALLGAALLFFLK